MRTFATLLNKDVFELQMAIKCHRKIYHTCERKK